MASRIRWRDLFHAAQSARLHAYAPYSRLRLGAAVMAADGEIYSGCNVENSSFGLSVCAERSAIFRSIGAGSAKIIAVAILCDSDRPCPPCGMCRQVMAEFADLRLPVRSRNLRGAEEHYLLGQLLPHSFSGQFLKKPNSPLPRRRGLWRLG